MSNLEHLMENALNLQRQIKTLDDWEQKEQEFINAWYNIEMAKDEGLLLSTVWDMAAYVTLTWCESLNREIQFLEEKVYKKELFNYGGIGTNS